MPYAATRRVPRRPSGGERVFSDDAGRIWTAAYTISWEREGAMQFSCISDAREAMRAIAVAGANIITDVSDETLRQWLRIAPRLGRLT
jgi:hypothetical protein